MEEALQEGASAAVLRNALVAAEQVNCKTAIADSAAAALARVETLEAAAPGGQVQLHRAKGEAEQGEAGVRAQAARKHPTLLEGGITGLARKVEPERSRPDLDGAAALSLVAAATASPGHRRAAGEEPEAVRRVAALWDVEAAAGFPALRKAVYAARAARVSVEALEPFERKLAAAVSIRQALEWAMAVRDIPAIHKAIARRADGMLDQAQLGRAEAVLAEEHAKEEMRARLQ